MRTYTVLLSVQIGLGLNLKVCDLGHCSTFVVLLRLCHITSPVLVSNSSLFFMVTMVLFTLLVVYFSQTLFLVIFSQKLTFVINVTIIVFVVRWFAVCWYCSLWLGVFFGWWTMWFPACSLTKNIMVLYFRLCADFFWWSCNQIRSVSRSVQMMRVMITRAVWCTTIVHSHHHNEQFSHTGKFWFKSLTLATVALFCIKMDKKLSASLPWSFTLPQTPV